ncbi:MAG: hypothetical protein AAF211_29635 [Myxococcota bacterium]
MAAPFSTSILLLALVGCAGETTVTSGDTGTAPEPVEPTADTGDTDEPDPIDTSPPPPECLQDSAAEVGNLEFVDGELTIDPDTLAVTSSAAAPAVALPEGLDDTAYYGAVDPDEATAWWEGWTYVDPAVDGSLPGGGHPLAPPITGGQLVGSKVNLCSTLDPSYLDGGIVTLFNEPFPVCVVQGRITADVTWPNDHAFLLLGPVIVGRGDSRLRGGTPSDSATLTIQPGTQVYGAQLEDNSLLLVTRGSRLVAEGTRDLPILFSSAIATEDGIFDNPVDLSVRGGWGGIGLQGFGVTNGGNSDAETTSFYTGGWYGGTEPTDSSGSLEYVVIAENGDQVGGGNNAPSFPGLLLEGVGSGTNVDHVQVIGGNGDCLGAFGGGAPLRHLVCSGTGDDSFDVDSGFSGSLQYGIVRMGAENGDNGIEADGNNQNFDAEPTTDAVFANVTVLGNAGNEDDDTRGALLREGARVQVFRSVFADDTAAGGGFEDGCVDIDDVVPDELQYRDVLFSCSPGPFAECEEGEAPLEPSAE